MDDDILSVHSYDSGENVVISGNDGRAAFTPGAGTTSLEASPQRPEEEQPKQVRGLVWLGGIGAVCLNQPKQVRGLVW